MNDLDFYYRAFLSYRAVTQNNRDCSNLRKAICQADPDSDKIVITRNICTVDEDWIEEIERGLVFVEKAIKEERQFIYSNGEVIEIEKVKHVSKDSVQHLAKHSNLITREQDGEDIIPDKLYTVERLNDYAVYENRFLYMLLCYLKDFITLRYNKILDLSNKYDGRLKINKEISLPKQRITYSVDLHDERRDDSYLREHNSAKDIIDRIDLILKTVLAFLATPLMEITGKAPMLKPPITKTNVLKMDNNFKGAVALYDFIIAYDKAGYTAEVQNVELSPFNDILAEDMSETIALSTFLTYAYGLDLNASLKQNYDAEEAKRRAQEIQKKQEQLEMLKRKLSAMQESPEEYILALEKQIKLLHNEIGLINPLREQVAQLKESEEHLTAELEKSRAENETLHEELKAAEIKHLAEMEAIKTEYEDRIHALLLKHEEEMKSLEKSCNERIEQLRAQMRQEAEELREKIREALAKAQESEEQFEKLSADYEKLLEAKELCEARITALRSEQSGEIGEDEYTDKESFDELEREYAAFTRFYQEKWGKTKKRIRKQLLNYDSLKGKKGQE